MNGVKKSDGVVVRSIVSQLQGAFSRKRTFYWSVMVIMGFCTRQDSMGGISSFIRCVGIEPKKYQRLLAFFHSRAINLDKLTELWVATVFSFFKTLFVTLNATPFLFWMGSILPKKVKVCPLFRVSIKYQLVTPRLNISWDIFFNVLEFW